MHPGSEFLQPLLGAQSRFGFDAQLKPLTDGINTQINNIVRVRDQAGLDRLTDHLLLFRVQLNCHFVPRLYYPSAICSEALSNGAKNGARKRPVTRDLIGRRSVVRVHHKNKETVQQFDDEVGVDVVGMFRLVDPPFASLEGIVKEMGVSSKGVRLNKIGKDKFWFKFAQRWFT
jgi:hypothetical protein